MTARVATLTRFAPAPDLRAPLALALISALAGALAATAIVLQFVVPPYCAVARPDPIAAIIHADELERRSPAVPL